MGTFLNRDQLDVRVVSATRGHFPVNTISSADDVVIATLQTVVAAYNRGHEKLTSFLDSADGKLVVVFDEAHRLAQSGRFRNPLIVRGSRQVHVFGSDRHPVWSSYPPPRFYISFQAWRRFSRSS